MPLIRSDLVSIAKRAGVPPEVIEKDYLLSYVLAALVSVSELRGLVFKGGTALKKAYFGDYRFSEDLDFSAVDVSTGDELDTIMAVAVRAAESRLNERGRFRLEFDRPPERERHPGGQDAFRIRAAFPWQSSPLVRVKVEITHDEPILLPASERLMLHDYEDLREELPGVRLATYALEAIVAEKLRALRQTQQRLQDRGWSRPRARDYYDLWRLLSDRGESIDSQLVQRILPAKLAHRGVSYQTGEDFFTPQLVAEARTHWKSNLGTFVADLPDIEVVLLSRRRTAQTTLIASGVLASVRIGTAIRVDWLASDCCLDEQGQDSGAAPCSYNAVGT